MKEAQNVYDIDGKLCAVLCFAGYYAMCARSFMNMSHAELDLSVSSEYYVHGHLASIIFTENAPKFTL